MNTATNLDFITLTKWLITYDGKSKFVKSVQGKYLEWGNITDNQAAALERVRATEGNLPDKLLHPIDPTFKAGQHIEVKTWLIKKIAQQFGIAFLFRNLELVEIKAESKKAIYAYIKCYSKPSIHCHCCGRDLTNAISRATGIGPICATKYFDISRPSMAEAKEVCKAIDAKAEKIGTIGPVWIAKSQIVEEDKNCDDNTKRKST